MHIYLSSNTTVILQLNCVSVVNSHWLYIILMTHMLNKLLNLEEKIKYQFMHPACRENLVNDVPFSQTILLLSHHHFLEKKVLSLF